MPVLAPIIVIWLFLGLVLCIPMSQWVCDQTEWAKRASSKLGENEKALAALILIITGIIWTPPIGMYFILRTFKNLIVNLELIPTKRPPNLELTLNRANETLEETNRLLDRISSGGTHV